MVQVAEYFAGIGLARIGLEQAGHTVTWSNDISAKKHALFVGHFGEESEHEYHVGDLGAVALHDMPADIDLAWASFPCTDLSLAGGRGGLHHGASAAYWHFIKNLAQLGKRRPETVILENVTGFASSHAGKDIRTAISSMNGLGYSVDILCVDSRRFVPQSRPRLFIIGRKNPPPRDDSPSVLRPSWLDNLFADPTLKTHRARLPEAPPLLTSGFTALAERLTPMDARWWHETKVSAFLDSLSDVQLVKLEKLKELPERVFRTAYRRMRNGVPRWEIRSDDVAGCLRTASGGSSRQAVVQFEQGRVQVRWMTPREYAALMGAPDYAIAPELSDNDAYSGFGDAVCVPVVAWLARHCVPIANAHVVDIADLAQTA
jgi:DNA (cytosine-5)-methyltransferase 1